MRYGTRPQARPRCRGTARQPPVKPRRPCRAAAGASAASLPESGDARPPRADGAAERAGKRQPRRGTRTAPRGVAPGPPPGTPGPHRPPRPVTARASSTSRRMRADRSPVRAEVRAPRAPVPLLPRCRVAPSRAGPFAVPGRSQGGAAPGRSPVARLGVVQVTSGDRAASYSAAHTRSWFMTRPYADAPPPAPAHEGRRSHDSGLPHAPTGSVRCLPVPPEPTGRTSPIPGATKSRNANSPDLLGDQGSCRVRTRGAATPPRSPTAPQATAAAASRSGSASNESRSKLRAPANFSRSRTFSRAATSTGTTA